MNDELYIYKALLDSVTDQGMLVCDVDGKIILYNDASSFFDGIPKSQALGKNYREVYSDDATDPIREAIETGKPVTNHMLYFKRRKGARQFQCLCDAYPIKKEGKILAVFVFARFQSSLRKLLSDSIDLQRQLLFGNDKKSHNGATFTFNDIIGSSSIMLSAVKKAKKAAFSPSNVLIVGETGTGKELFAQSIHNASIFRDKPFVAINCAAIPESLLESTLFGTTKGAFTGADNMPGLFEQAQGGTIFLDEINSMPLHLQSKLLRVLQEKSVRRIGAKAETPIQCRVISSCNRPPLDCVKYNIIREDLFYRLSIVTIDIPPLREQGDDIIILAEYFMQKYATIFGATSVKMTEEFKEALQMHSWPGNVRELQHVIECAMVMLEPGEELSVQHLPHSLACRQSKPAKSSLMNYNGTLKNILINAEKDAIINALKKNNWNITRSAKSIGISRSNLQYRMNKLGIDNIGLGPLPWKFNHERSS